MVKHSVVKKLGKKQRLRITSSALVFLERHMEDVVKEAMFIAVAGEEVSLKAEHVVAAIKEIGKKQ